MFQNMMTGRTSQEAYLQQRQNARPAYMQVGISIEQRL